MSGVLITRPEPGCSETAAAVAALGWQPLPAPALVLSPLPLAGGGASPQALLLPSRAAARALAADAAASRFLDTPVLAVGEGTAREAEEAGFTQILSAEGDAVSLAALAARRLDPRGGPLLLAVGRGYGGELSADLRRRGFTLHRRVVYAATPARSLPEPALAALRQGRVRAVLFFSPRSATATMRLLREAGLGETVRDMAALALSPRIARALSGMPWRAIRATAAPEASALPALLGRAPPGP
jgi:uroporphyrinogen-III synthase